MNLLVLIPARGGSKGIPGKNLALIAGKPLIAWTIEAARASGLASRILVSTDSPEIAEAARHWGADVPWLRPPELAADETPSLAVARHALERLRDAEGLEPNWLTLLQPTSPFRTAADIAAALALAVSENAESVISVTPAPVHPAWLFDIDEHRRLMRYDATVAKAERQSWGALYAPNGAIYIVKSSVLRNGGSWYGPGAYGYVMPAERSLDIDTPWDLHLARLVLEDRMRQAPHGNNA